MNVLTSQGSGHQVWELVRGAGEYRAAHCGNLLSMACVVARVAIIGEGQQDNRSRRSVSVRRLARASLRHRRPRRDR